MLNTVKSRTALGGGLALLLILLGVAWQATAHFGTASPVLMPGVDEHGKPLSTIPWVVEGAARVHQGDTVTIGGLFACLNRSGSVTVDSITAIKPTGLQVTGWGIRPNPSWIHSPTTGMGQLGVSRHTLAQLQFPATHQVTAKCGTLGQGVEFGLEVRKTTSAEAGLSKIRVTYTSGGSTKVLTYAHGVRLCNEQTAAAKTCRALKV